MKREWQFKFLLSAGLERNYNFMDIGSGSLRNSDTVRHLLPQRYHGIEVREDAYLASFDEINELGLELKFPDIRLFSDFRELAYSYPFDMMLAFSVLIHMEDEIAYSCLEFVKINLSENGRFFANVNVENEDEGRWNGFPLVFKSFDFYHDIASQNGLDCVSLGTMSDLSHNSGSELGDKQLMLQFMHKH